MKFRKSLIYIFLVLLMVSCGSDDDICTSGEATPRIKIKFKTKETGKLKTLDSLYINVDYGNGQIPVIATKLKTDSVFVPLRVDENSFTEIYVGLSKTEIDSKIKINYETKTEYVSPACGIKKIYENVSSSVTIPNAVLETEQNQTQIIDESKTHLFLLF